MTMTNVADPDFIHNKDIQSRLYGVYVYKYMSIRIWCVLNKTVK